MFTEFSNRLLLFTPTVFCRVVAMNWQAHIQKLRASGMTLADIAAKTGTQTSTVSEIARGATREPRGQLAINLYELRPDVVPAPEPQAPAEAA